MRNKIWFMVLVLGLVAGAAGLALSAVHRVTSPVIEKRILEEKIKPTLDRFFGELNVENDYIADRTVLELGKDHMGRKIRLTVFKGKKGGEVVAAALQTSASGYGGDIDVLTAFDLAEEKILGVKTLSQKETKGLGTRVADDDNPFIEQFQGMGYAQGVALTAEGGQVDALSGSTITSAAFASAVDKAARLLDERSAEIEK
jgi:Na+-translocating ferredoxin:NAD+ oxidoreductase subunit G